MCTPLLCLFLETWTLRLSFEIERKKRIVYFDLAWLSFSICWSEYNKSRNWVMYPQSLLRIRWFLVSRGELLFLSHLLKIFQSKKCSVMSVQKKSCPNYLHLMSFKRSGWDGGVSKGMLFRRSLFLRCDKVCVLCNSTLLKTVIEVGRKNRYITFLVYLKH